MKITAAEIAAIHSKKIIAGKFEVKKAGSNLYNVFGFSYGKKEKKVTGSPEKVAAWINQYLGYEN